MHTFACMSSEYVWTLTCAHRCTSTPCVPRLPCPHTLPVFPHANGLHSWQCQAGHMHKSMECWHPCASAPCPLARPQHQPCLRATSKDMPFVSGIRACFLCSTCERGPSLAKAGLPAPEGCSSRSCHPHRYLTEASRTPNSLHVVYINTSLYTKVGQAGGHGAWTASCMAG